MAPPKTDSDDFKFIMTCIKYSPDKLKPDFEEVARETGAKSANACYHKHWGIMRKWGLTGSKKGGNAGSNTPTPTRKRKAAASKADLAGTGYAGMDGGSPSKKRKVAGADNKTAVKEEVEAITDDEAVLCKDEDGECSDEATKAEEK